MNQADQREAGIPAITAAAKGSLTTQPSISRIRKIPVDELSQLRPLPDRLVCRRPGACLESTLAGDVARLRLSLMHFALARDRAVQVRLALVAVVVGLGVDSAQLAVGAFRFPHGTLVEGLPPPAFAVSCPSVKRSSMRRASYVRRECR
ncbi:MAG: DUF2878 family protein [Planctomycetota bacterium]|nr:MAG: DUF2878 family protein [Planctomycetota bacterium]REK49410.1 MAG: DUF2878 family protein [Planctomycetota bacterium]